MYLLGFAERFVVPWHPLPRAYNSTVTFSQYLQYFDLIFTLIKTVTYITNASGLNIEVSHVLSIKEGQYLFTQYDRFYS